MGRAASCRALVTASVGLFLAVLLPGVAHGAVISGTQINWPDAAYDVNANAYNPSIARLDVTYDDTAGMVTTAITLDRPAVHGQYYSVRYTLARPQAGRDCQDSRYLTPMVQVYGSVSTGYSYTSSSGEFDANSGYTGYLRGTTLRRTDSEYQFSISNSVGLVRQDLRCVMAVEAQTGSWYGASQDYEAGNFCVGPCPPFGPVIEPPPVLVQPPAPTGLRASVSGRDVTLTWNPSTDPNFAYFAVRRDKQPNPTTSTWQRLAGNHTSATARDTVPEPGRWYYYVTQINKSGRASAKSAVVRIDVAAPPRPTNLRASVNGQTVTLAWDASLDAGFSHFAVRRDTQPNVLTATWTRIGGNWTSTSATDTPGPGRFYYYVTRVNRDGQFSAKSDKVTVDVGAPVVIPDPPVTGAGSQTTNTSKPSTSGTAAGSGTPAVPTAPVIIVQGQSPVVAAPPSAQGQRAVSAAQALRQARTALRLVYKRAFTKGKRFKARCRRSTATRRTCTVSWRYKRFSYSGRVVVRLANDAYSTTVSVKRTRIR